MVLNNLREVPTVGDNLRKILVHMPGKGRIVPCDEVEKKQPDCQPLLGPVHHVALCGQTAVCGWCIWSMPWQDTGLAHTPPEQFG